MAAVHGAGSTLALYEIVLVFGLNLITADVVWYYVTLGKTFSVYGFCCFFFSISLSLAVLFLVME